jgi:hypothetical protein
MPLDCRQSLTLLASNAARDRYDLRSHNVPKVGLAEGWRRQKVGIGESDNQTLAVPDPASGPTRRCHQYPLSFLPVVNGMAAKSAYRSL